MTKSKLFIFVICFSFALLAQNKIDSLHKAEKPARIQIDTNKIELPKVVFPIQYFLYESRIKGLNEKFFRNNKLLDAELEGNYTFGKDELNSGLTDDELIAYVKNKKRTMQILRDEASSKYYVDWEKIQKILGISEEAATVILGIVSLMKFH